MHIAVVVLGLHQDLDGVVCPLDRGVDLLCQVIILLIDLLSELGSQLLRVAQSRFQISDPLGRLLKLLRQQVQLCPACIQLLILHHPLLAQAVADTAHMPRVDRGAKTKKMKRP